MTNITIETYNGKQCTVIRKPFDAEWVKEQLSMGIPFQMSEGITGNIGNIVADNYHFKDWIASANQRGTKLYLVTILPPLPRRPKPEDAPLLYRYASEGLMPYGIYEDDIDYIEGVVTMIESSFCTTPYLHFLTLGAQNEWLDRWENCFECEITHALYNGEKVAIAIDGGEDD